MDKRFLLFMENWTTILLTVTIVEIKTKKNLFDMDLTEPKLNFHESTTIQQNLL